MSLLVVMGSGETAPTMVKVHREVLARSGTGPAVMLDTPFGFQMNADDLVERTRQYFADSVGTKVEVARWRRADAPAAEHERSLALLTRAAWVFAGPGSPTYALRQWQGSALPDALADVAERGGTLVFGSAAACTIGTHTIPVYEIYKVGDEPSWAAGLDLVGRLTGLAAVVVPHYDNAEGGRHDTRFCYLGEQRLTALEADLPEGTGVFGVDEHTAVVIDLTARTAEVVGNGLLTLRHRDRSTTFAATSILPLDAVAALLRGDREAVALATPPASSGSPAAPAASAASATTMLVGLAGQTEQARSRFDTALEAGHVDDCVAAILDLEQAIVEWSADTLESDDTDRARRLLRALIVRLGELARTGAADPRDAVQPFVDTLLEMRARARTGKDFATSDLIRDRLVAAGVEVRDTPEGAHWVLSTR